MLPEVIALDVETTGLARDSHILELGLIGADSGFKEIFSVCYRVATDKPFEEWKEASEHSHGLIEEDIATAMGIKEVTAAVEPLFLDKPLLVGHNIKGYDIEIIEDTPLERCTEGCDLFDTMTDIPYKSAKYISLEKAAKVMGESHAGKAHSAVYDARTSLRIMRAFTLD